MSCCQKSHLPPQRSSAPGAWRRVSSCPVLLCRWRRWGYGSILWRLQSSADDVWSKKAERMITGSSHAEASGVEWHRLGSLQPRAEMQPNHVLPRALHSHPSLLVFLLGSFKASPHRFPCGTRQAGNHRVSCELSYLGHSEWSENTEFDCEVTKSKDWPMLGWDLSDLPHRQEQQQISPLGMGELWAWVHWEKV